MRIAYYCPMKPPDGDRPSGDRLMARQIAAALDTAGCDVRLVSRLRTWLKEPHEAAMRAVEDDAAREAAALVDAFRAPADGWRPDLWLTYHLYHRAPDLIGPPAARALGVPYAALEASHAARRMDGPWARWAQAAAAAIRGADLIGAMTARDLEGLEALPGRKGRLVHVPPFLADPGEPVDRTARRAGPVRIVAVAMMRPGAKRAGYELMAASLALAPGGPSADWTLDVLGGGPERGAVEAALRAACGARVAFAGEQDAAGVRAALAQADIFLWPGIGEAYGMVYLEAAAAGLPAVGCRSGGVPDVVRDGLTGLLAAEGDAQGLAAALARLIRDEALRRRLGAAGARFVRRERSLAGAAALLKRELDAARAAREAAA